MSYLEYVTTDDEREDPLGDLARTNGFTLHDLANNRKGRISNRQWRGLLWRALEPVRYSGGAMAGWLLFCFVVKTLVPDIVLMIASLFGGKSIGAIFGAITLACAGSLVVALLRSGRAMTLLLVDLKDGRAVCLEGRVSPSREDRDGLGMARMYGQKHTHRWYVLNNEYFEVDEEAYNALPRGGLFRLYCTPRSRLMLSVEPK